MKRLLARSEPLAGLAMLPVEPTKKSWRYASPDCMLLSCMLWLSVGVNQRKLGGLAEFAAATKSEVETLLPANMQEQLDVSENPVNGKWSLPLGHPLSQ